MLESKEWLKTNYIYGANWKSSQWPKLKQYEQQNKTVLDYNPKYNIYIYVYYIYISMSPDQYKYMTEYINGEKRQIYHAEEFKMIYVIFHSPRREA